MGMGGERAGCATPVTVLAASLFSVYRAAEANRTGGHGVAREKEGRR
jgi:hypothetical protein